VEQIVYEFILRRELSADENVSHKAVSNHTRSCADFLNCHKKDVGRALDDGLGGARELAPYLFRRIADARTMRLAWDFLATNGGGTPGPNGRRYGDYDTQEVWALCRCLAKAIRDGKYDPGEERIMWIDKDSGHGRRPLVLLNIEDRVVQRAIMIILQPVLDPLFDARSFGFRPRLNHWHALALAEWLTLEKRRRFWVTADIKDAFQHVPLSRLLQIVRKLLPAHDLIDLLERVLPGQMLPGLRQGGSLSPLMLNVYLHYTLDRPWRRYHARVPLIRVADDLLAVCTKTKAKEARDALHRLLQPAGMPLKEVSESAVCDLDAGDNANWLGLTIRKAARGLAFEIAERSWTRLETYFALAHTKGDAPLRAVHTIKQWINQRGPCYQWSDRAQACQRVIALARAQAFEEIPGPQELLGYWQRSYARWGKLRKSVRTNAGDC
jgi:hypothetical protein